MAQFVPEQSAGGGQKLLPHAVRDLFKYEIASELGLVEDIAQKGWGNMASRSCGSVGGRIGGRMVRVLIRHAEQALADGQPPT